MWKRILAFVMLGVIVVGGIGAVIYFSTRPKPIGGPDLDFNTKYYMTDMAAGLYNYPDAVTGMKSEDRITLLNSNTNKSYCMFDEGWKIFRMHFEHTDNNTALTRTADFAFVVTKMKRGAGGIDANVSHIYDGYIISYRITATRESINVVATAIYNVTVASDEYATPPTKEVFRENITKITFARVTPEYITALGGI